MYGSQQGSSSPSEYLLKTPGFPQGLFLCVCEFSGASPCARSSPRDFHPKKLHSVSSYIFSEFCGLPLYQQGTIRSNTAPTPYFLCFSMILLGFRPLNLHVPSSRKALLSPSWPRGWWLLSGCRPAGVGSDSLKGGGREGAECAHFLTPHTCRLRWSAARLGLRRMFSLSLHWQCVPTSVPLASSASNGRFPGIQRAGPQTLAPPTHGLTNWNAFVDQQTPPHPPP